MVITTEEDSHEDRLKIAAFALRGVKHSEETLKLLTNDKAALISTCLQLVREGAGLHGHHIPGHMPHAWNGGCSLGCMNKCLVLVARKMLAN